MRIFAISEGALTHDITDLSHCLSAESRLLKASPTCALVYVDGSEKRGSARIAVHIQYNTLNTEIIFRVWYPRLPLTVHITDTILNRIDSWIQSETRNLNKMKKNLGSVLQRQKRRQKRDLHSYTERFQQTQV